MHLDDYVFFAFIALGAVGYVAWRDERLFDLRAGQRWIDETVVAVHPVILARPPRGTRGALTIRAGDPMSDLWSAAVRLGHDDARLCFTNRGRIAVELGTERRVFFARDDLWLELLGEAAGTDRGLRVAAVDRHGVSIELEVDRVGLEALRRWSAG